MRSGPPRSKLAPRLGPTVRSSTMVRSAGSAPARSRTARSLALSAVKLPDIWPLPPVIGSRICGAEITLSSRMIANRRPTFCCVAWPKRCAPLLSKRKETTGSLVCWSNEACASTRFSPETMTRSSMTKGSGGSSVEYMIEVPAGGRPLIASSTGIDWSTIWKVSLAVCPRMSLRRCGSCRPGTWTRMRSEPWRWIIGSVVPSSLTRRLTTSMDWVSAAATR